MLRTGLALAAVISLAALRTPQAYGATTDEVWMTFATIGAGRAATPSLVSQGTSDVVVRTVASGGGQLTATASANGASGAVQFPAYTDGMLGAPRAVVAVTNSGAVDTLNPGSRSFAFGADVRLDATSEGTAVDNGNNVVQRGLYDGSAQYKIQVDGTSASCRVKGAAGAVQAAVAVTRLAWYRLTCSFAAGAGAGTVIMTAAPIDADGTLGPSRSTTRTGQVGALRYTVDTPLSVGGKLTNTSTLPASSDQFNGRLDNVWLRIP